MRPIKQLKHQSAVAVVWVGLFIDGRCSILPNLLSSFIYYVSFYTFLHLRINLWIFKQASGGIPKCTALVMRAALVAQPLTTTCCRLCHRIRLTLRLINYATSNRKVRSKLCQVAFACSIRRQTHTRNHARTHSHTVVRNTNAQHKQTANTQCHLASVLPKSAFDSALKALTSCRSTDYFRFAAPVKALRLRIGRMFARCSVLIWRNDWGAVGTNYRVAAQINKLNVNLLVIINNLWSITTVGSRRRW